MRPSIMVKAPKSGFVIDNIAAPGSGKITLSGTAEATVEDESGRYEVGFIRPANKPGPIKPQWVFDKQKREMWDASDFNIKVSKSPNIRRG